MAEKLRVREGQKEKQGIRTAGNSFMIIQCFRRQKEENFFDPTSHAPTIKRVCFFRLPLSTFLSEISVCVWKCTGRESETESELLCEFISVQAAKSMQNKSKNRNTVYLLFC